MKRAQDMALINRAYANKLFEMTEKLISYLSESKNASANELYLVISPNKGLCGSLLTNLYKKILEVATQKKASAFFITFGKKAQLMVKKISSQVLASFEYGMSQPKYETIVPIAKMVLSEFEALKFGRVFVIYTDFVNTLVQKAAVKQILPIVVEKENSFSENNDVPTREYIFEPSRETIIKELIPYYVENQIFQLVLESYASEQSARMVAMKNATDNAIEVMKDLTLIYNRERQTQITNEIADIATAQLVI